MDAAAAAAGRASGAAPRRGRRPRIDLAAVVRAALDLGIERFSVVAVAEQLGVSDAAIYRYVPTRDRLQSLAADLAWSEVVTAAPATVTWEDYCRVLADRAADVAVRHPGVATYVMAGPYEPATVSSFERAMAELTARQPQFDVDRSYVVISRVLHVALGYVSIRNEIVRRANAGLWRWHLDALVDGMAAAVARGDLPPAGDWTTVRAAVTLAPLSDTG